MVAFAPGQVFTIVPAGLPIPTPSGPIPRELPRAALAMSSAAPDEASATSGGDGAGPSGARPLGAGSPGGLVPTSAALAAAACCFVRSLADRWATERVRKVSLRVASRAAAAALGTSA
eukprot:14450792-Alexandrium_andersonii.AAC.1